MRDFNQCHVGPHVQFFGKAFMERWNFRPYTDTNKPVVFFGVNRQHELINNHKGPKIIITSGPVDLPDWNIIKNRKIPFKRLNLMFKIFISIGLFLKIQSNNLLLKNN